MKQYEYRAITSQDLGNEGAGKLRAKVIHADAEKLDEFGLEGWCAYHVLPTPDRAWEFTYFLRRELASLTPTPE